MKISIELKVKSCFPKGQTLEEQVDKVREEYLEMMSAKDNIHIAEEALHIATAAVGVAEIAVKPNKKMKEGDICVFGDVEKYLQDRIDKRYEEKQIDFAEGRD
ncbi:hypothetical protein MWH25_01315 [Natroniella acetigena]|uniref:hypothetical protein n=1 Tax=Natroniella acetigena TaxID=52004 RepID=UPI00200B7315|nr:hypothetical protein [Natroniella acetigena]MCK8826386.1 hypothetical protein [Natroniella acetigena]